MTLRILKAITHTPRRLLYNSLLRKAQPIDPRLYVINIIVQRLFRINCHVPWMVHYTSKVSGDIRIGKDVWISFAVSGGCYIQGLNGIVIDDETIFAPGVKIISANHDLDDFDNIVRCGPITIGKRCWIGANAVILPEVVLGDGVVVGAGSVVTKSFAESSVVAGNPARLIKTRS